LFLGYIIGQTYHGHNSLELLALEGSLPSNDSSSKPFLVYYSKTTLLQYKLLLLVNYINYTCTINSL